jgi:hypothetical protein
MWTGFQSWNNVKYDYFLITVTASLSVPYPCLPQFPKWWISLSYPLMRETARRVKMTAKIPPNVNVDWEWEFLSFPLPAESKWQTAPRPIHWMKKEMKIKMRNFSHSSLSFLAAGKKGTNVHPELNCLKFLKKDKLKNFEKMFARQSAWLLLLVSTSTTLFILLAWETRNLLLGKILKKMGAKFLVPFIFIFHNFSHSINSPNQNEIVGQFPGRVYSRVVRLFPVWTPSQSETIAIDLCGVNGLVAVHWPNLIGKTTSTTWHAHSTKEKTTIYLNPASAVWTSGQTFRPFVPGHIFYPTLNEITR